MVNDHFLIKNNICEKGARLPMRKVAAAFSGDVIGGGEGQFIYFYHTRTENKQFLFFLKFQTICIFSKEQW